ncbi:MAG: ATP synthase F1 subunit delta [Myxococcota bacterium]|nr:ATP synthase F1 subunit delta [Myxococcota bacterium]
MTTGSIARRYAKALFAIGEEKGNLLGLHREVQNMADIWAGSEDLRITITNPLLRTSAKRQIWSTILSRLGISIIGKNFFYLLFDKGRCAELPGIAREFSALSDRKENRLRAEIITATPLSDNVSYRLKAALQRRTGKMVVMTKREDPDVLGGVITRVGDVMYDGSLKTQLKRMKEAMLGQG